MIDSSSLPKNIKLKKEVLLDIPKDLKNFDTVIVVMLLHHLVGNSVSENLKNLNKCLEETNKTLTKNGQLIIVESCAKLVLQN